MRVENLKVEKAEDERFMCSACKTRLDKQPTMNLREIHVGDISFCLCHSCMKSLSWLMAVDVLGGEKDG